MNTVTVEAEVSLRDIKESLDFSDLLDLYEMGTDQVCDSLDADEVIAWATQQSEFTHHDTIRALCEDEDFVRALMQEIHAHHPEALEDGKEQPIITYNRHESGLFVSVLRDGAIVAIVAGREASVKQAEGEKALHFKADTESDALTLVKLLLNSAVQS